SHAARTLCAWREAERALRASHRGASPPEGGGELLVTSEDVIAAAELALAHRRRAAHEPGPPVPAATSERAQERYQDMAREARAAARTGLRVRYVPRIRSTPPT